MPMDPALLPTFQRRFLTFLVDFYKRQRSLDRMNGGPIPSVVSFDDALLADCDPAMWLEIGRTTPECMEGDGFDLTMLRIAHRDVRLSDKCHRSGVKYHG